MGVQIYDFDCPDCGKTCWVNNGDVSDLTVPDVDEVICPWCGVVCFLDDLPDDCWSSRPATPEDDHVDRAGKTPNDVT